MKQNPFKNQKASFRLSFSIIVFEKSSLFMLDLSVSIPCTYFMSRHMPFSIYLLYIHDIYKPLHNNISNKNILYHFTYLYYNKVLKKIRKENKQEKMKEKRFKFNKLIEYVY